MPGVGIFYLRHLLDRVRRQRVHRDIRTERARHPRICVAVFLTDATRLRRAAIGPAAGPTGRRWRRQDPGTWGEPTPMPDVLAQVALETDMRGKVAVLASDAGNALAAAWARVFRALMARDP